MKLGRRKEYLDVVVRSLSVTVVVIMYTRLHLGNFDTGLRETKARWPPLTIEIEENGDSKRTNERGPS